MYAQDRPVTAPRHCPFNRTLRSFGGETRGCENEACECFVVTSRSKRGVALRGRCGLVAPSPDGVVDTTEAVFAPEDSGEFDLKGD